MWGGICGWKWKKWKEVIYRYFTFTNVQSFNFIVIILDFWLHCWIQYYSNVYFKTQGLIYLKIIFKFSLFISITGELDYFEQVDLIKLSSFPILKRFLGTDEGLELKVQWLYLIKSFVCVSPSSSIAVSTENILLLMYCEIQWLFDKLFVSIIPSDPQNCLL